MEAAFCAAAVRIVPILAGVSRVASPQVGVAVCLALLGGFASAQSASTSASVERSFNDDWLQVRFRGSAAIRSGGQNDPTSQLSYTGFTPNDLALQGWVWPLLGGHLGAGLNVGREGFGLYDAGTRVTSGGLARVEAGLSGRLMVGPAHFEALAGYGYHELPVFTGGGTPVFGTAARHSILLAARGLVDLGPVTVEGRFTYPIALATVSQTLGALQSSPASMSAGASVRVNVAVTGPVHWGLLGDFVWLSDRVTKSDGTLDSSQSVFRLGLGLDVRLREELKKTPRFGRVRLTVVDADGNAPLAQAAVELKVGTEVKQLSADAAGAVALGELLPGLVVAKASVGGYVSAEQSGEVQADQETVLQVALAKEKPKVGALSVVVTDKEGGKPLANVSLEVGGRTGTTDAAGKASFEGLPPGPLSVKLTADGYQPGDEAASVVAGKTAELAVQLLSAKKRVPATISGQVRSAQGGRPIAATLELPEAKIKTRADAQGSFVFRVPGGEYTVRVSAKGYRTQTKTVSVRDGDQTIFNIDLFPK